MKKALASIVFIVFSEILCVSLLAIFNGLTEDQLISNLLYSHLYF